MQRAPSTASAETAELLRDILEHAAARPARRPSVSSTSSSETPCCVGPPDEAYWEVHERNGRARPPQPGTVRWCYVQGESHAERAHMLSHKESLMPGVYLGLRGIGALGFDERDKGSLHNIILLNGDLHKRMDAYPPTFLLAPSLAAVIDASKLVEQHLVGEEAKMATMGDDVRWDFPVGDIPAADWNGYREYQPTYCVTKYAEVKLHVERESDTVWRMLDLDGSLPNRWHKDGAETPLPTKLLPLAFISAAYHFYAHVRLIVRRLTANTGTPVVLQPLLERLMAYLDYFLGLLEIDSPSAWRLGRLRELRSQLDALGELPAQTASSNARRRYAFEAGALGDLSMRLSLDYRAAPAECARHRELCKTLRPLLSNITPGLLRSLRHDELPEPLNEIAQIAADVHERCEEDAD